MAKIEISIFQRGSLSRRMDCLATLELKRHAERCTISWQFTTNNAHEKLHRLYPDLTTHLD